MPSEFVAGLQASLPEHLADSCWNVYARPSSRSTMEDARSVVAGQGEDWLVHSAAMQPQFSEKPCFAVIAAEQSAGRGRSGRNWSSVAGSGMYATFAVFPPRDEFLEALSLIVGVAVRRSLLEFGVEAGLKWPNDVVISCGQEFKKISGVLIERTQGSGTSLLSIGIGINVAASEEAAAVGGTSLADLGVKTSVTEVFSAAARCLEAVLLELFEAKRGALLSEWRSASVMNGLLVKRDGDEEFWRVRGIDDRGGLLVYSPGGAGREETIYSGEVLVYAAGS